ncbi:SAM-dependent methyltransferase [Streptomyces sp. MP131-18]|uniref:SAM-dependent methyltransferase n=1 Tax=Streptomyces sp. MP131-18 TaxID=1857892 RepID=UPI00097C4FBE|nr:SAM-dependent methyltransferase [Streptomyces sp. MP131-18]ONK13189.1 S-adenosyl methyltransferase [Streptomyces sp. MP131-18]
MDANREDAMSGIDTTVPHSARIWNYWLGGKENYSADREVGDIISGQNPGIITIAREQRYFLARAVRFLTREVGIRQFLDIGTGLPAVDNTHELAQREAPESRVVYVDNDPLVLAHARALLASAPQGATDYIDADIHHPDTILTEASKTLDFTRPIALMLLGITAHITDDTAYTIVDRLMNALPSGSYLVLCDDTEVINPEAMRAMIHQWNSSSDNPRINRSPQQLHRFFEGLDLLDPGLVSITRWRPELSPLTNESVEIDDFGGVARMP